MVVYVELGADALHVNSVKPAGGGTERGAAEFVTLFYLSSSEYYMYILRAKYCKYIALAHWLGVPRDDDGSQASQDPG